MSVKALVDLIEQNKNDPSVTQYVGENSSFQDISRSLQSVAGHCNELVPLVEINASVPSCEANQQMDENTCVEQRETRCTQQLPYSSPYHNTRTQEYEHDDLIFVEQLNRLKAEVERVSKHEWAHDTIAVHHQPMEPLHIH
jgi:hypothetical protein